ncbi:MAG: DUF1501 domain-containing protein [Planctomycetaceae bacterium]
MLSVFDGSQPCNRRAVLSVGGLGFGGLSLGNLLAARACAATGRKPITTGKSVIFLLQHGGPTQFETWDPKLDVPDGIRTQGGVVRTSIPGVHFGASMSGVASHAHRLAIVRSYTTGSASHSNRPLISEASRQANIGSVFARFAGANDHRTGMPNTVNLHPNAINPQDLGPDERFGKFAATGTLGSAFAPFAPGGASALQRDMELVLPRSRFDDRRSLLAALDRLRRDVDRSGSMQGLDHIRQQAFEMVIRGVADAFDLSRENPQTVARYDTSRYEHATKYADKSNGNSKRGWYQANARSLGRLLLLARRLCEAGCGFVTVATRFVWDMHGDKNNLGITRGLDAVIKPFDHAVSAFIEDCEERGLADKILLVTAGEMGRTPKINKRGGRDHWARLAPLMLYGGGVTHGQVIGRSTRDGAEPASDPVNSEHLVSTILRTLLDVPELRIAQGFPRDLMQLASTGTPIPGLF